MNMERIDCNKLVELAKTQMGAHLLRGDIVRNACRGCLSLGKFINMGNPKKCLLMKKLTQIARHDMMGLCLEDVLMAKE